MKCSCCSDIVKPIVALDIDGTLGDYHGHLLKFAQSYFGHAGVHSEPYRGDEPYRDWFCTRFACDLRTFRDVKLAYRQGAQKRSMPAFAEARILSRDLHTAGAEVWLTTTRPYLRLDNIDPDTRAWLERNHIYYDMLMYDENKYRVLAERVDPRRVVGVLDDDAEQVAEAAQVYGADRVLLRDGSYNRDSSIPEGVHRVYSLGSAAVTLTNMIAEWKRKHANS